MKQDLVIIGSGGLDIIRLLEDINADTPKYNILGFLEKDSSKIGQIILGYPILGNDSLLLSELKHCVVVNNVMQNPHLHQSVYNTLYNDYHIDIFPNLIHPNVDMRFVKCGIGNIIYERNSFGPCVEIGNHNILYAASIGHETKVENFNLMAQTKIGSRCTIGSFNLIGNSSTIANSVRIGNDNVIGVGAVVMKNCADSNHLLGYPAISAKEFSKKYLLHHKQRKYGD